MTVTNARPKVLIVTTARDVSGPVKGVFQFLNSLDGEIDYYLYNIRSNSTCCQLLEQGAVKAGVELHSFDHSHRFSTGLLGAVSEFVDKHNIDIIQTHGYKPSIFGFYIRLRARIPWVCFFHGLTTENMKVRVYHLIDKISHLFASRLIIISDAMRNQVFSRLNKNRTTVIRNAVELPANIDRQNKKESFLKELEIHPDRKLLVVVGRLSPEKGVDVFMEAFAELYETEKAVHAVIVGDGQERGDLEQLAKKLDCEKGVSFTGFRSSVAEFIQSATIVVIPSRSEGIPNVLLEAMSFGRAVVATSVGGIPEVVQHKKEALLVEPERPTKLASAIKELLDDATMRESLARAGRKKVEENFSPEARKQQILSVYRDVLGK